MTGRSGVTKARFHAALSEAVRRHLGSEWTRFQFNRECIARQPAVRRASVWWDDRKKDPTALAFSNVLWVNGLKYGAERRYQVRKESVAPQFVEAIEGMVREVAEQADQWYAEAGRELDRREGVQLQVAAVRDPPSKK